MVRSGIKLIKKKNKVGILGGSFDPAHKGHLTISKEAIKRFDLQNVIWAITKKNPFKRKTKTSLNNRIKYCKKIIGSNKFVKVKKKETILNLIHFKKEPDEVKFRIINKTMAFNTISFANILAFFNS